MIKIRNLYKRYHNHHGSDWILKNINLTIPKGVSVGLIGANGAGKSTLLRLIAGIDMPERGEVIRHSRVSWPVGLSGGMQGNMTGRQNVKFVARMQGSSPKEVERIIQFVEEFSEIGDAFDEPVRTYSSGMRSRISFGLSLAFDFDVYISDEATAVGDRAFKDKAKKLFKSKVGKSSLIMVSHGEGVLRDLCEAGIYLKEGHAYWHDDINDAIISYHKDSETHESHDNQVSYLSESSRDNTKELIKEIKTIRQHISGITNILHQAKNESWPKEEISTLVSIRKTTIDKASKLEVEVNKTKEGSTQKIKKEINLANNSILAFNDLIYKNDNIFTKEELKVFRKSLNAAYSIKNELENKKN